MAKLHPEPFTPPSIDFGAANLREQIDASWKAVEAAGALITFPVADGKAVYIVRSVSPPVLQWVDWLDGYRADPALIRGLRSSDIKARVAQRKAIAALFARK